MNRSWALVLWLSFVHSEYTVHKVTCSGIFTHGDTYKRLYGLARNDGFSQELHEQGLAAIQKELQDQGYLDAHVTAACAYHERDGTVDIPLVITRGARYTITQVRAEAPLLHPTNDTPILDKITHLGTKYLLGTSYSRDALEKRVNRIQEYLINKGYLNPMVTPDLVLNTERHEVEVVFRCGLKHRREVFFSGNNFFSTRQLYNIVQDFGLSLAVVPGTIVAEKLTEQYHNEGFFDVSIVSRDQQGLHFSIHEGPRAIIAHVQIDAPDLPPQYYPLIAHVQRVLLKKKYYDKKLFNDVLSECVENLMHEGFWHAEITDISWRKQDAAYGITVSLTCGVQQRMHACTIENCPDTIREKFQYIFKKKSGESVPIDVFTLGAMRKFLQKELQKKGYLYTTVSFALHEERDRTTLVWKCNGPTDPVRFGETILKGVRCVPEYVVLRELAYQQGETWNTQARDATVQSLRNLGIFDSVTLFPEDITAPEQSKRMVLQCRESAPFELKARAGFQGVGTNLTWRGGATYKFGGTCVWKNPTARADIVNVQADITRFMSNFTVMYQLPWLGSLPLRNQYKAYSVRYEQPIVLGSRDILYRFSQDGFLCALSQQFSLWQWGVTSGFEWLRVDDLSLNRAHAIDFTTAFIQRKIPYWFGELNFFINAVDNRLDPTRGSSTLVSCKLQVPFTVSCASTAKFFVEQSGYIPLSREYRVILALRLRLGFIAYQEFNRIMPPERFYLGGAYSLRGYQPDLAPPLNIYHDSDGQLCYVPTGGKSMVNSNIELRFPLYQALSAAAFVDLGLLTQKAFTAVTAGDLLGAAGWGLRWNTPLGPLRFDIGWRLRKLPERPGVPCQAPYVWFLTVGNAF